MTSNGQMRSLMASVDEVQMIVPPTFTTIIEGYSRNINGKDINQENELRIPLSTDS